ncbi:MAG: helix-turn-helix transcriptional regulator [Burkholderiaceae bacterium]
MSAAPGPHVDEDAIHKALANPIRRAILEWLKDPAKYFPEREHPGAEGVCAGQIEARLALAQSTVSGHLAALQLAGLLMATPVGQWVFFRRNEPVIRAFVERLNRDL